MDHPLNKLLLSPNFLQREGGFAYASVAFRILGGDSYIWVNTGFADPLSPDAEPLELWALPPTAASLKSENGSFFYQVTQTAECGSVFVPQRNIPLDATNGRSNIIQWSTFNPNTICHGASPLRAANTNWDIYRFGNIWNRTYFEHGCRPSTALVAAEAIPDKSFQRLKKELHELYAGMTNGNGRPLVLDAGVKPVELSQNPKDSDFTNSHDQMQRDIARTLRIPPILLSLGADSTFTNQEQARLWLWDETIVPLVNDFVAELNHNLVPRFRKEKNIFIEADYSEVPALEPRRIEKWKRADDSDDLSINEKREMKGFEPVPGGDVVLIDSNKIPLQLASFTPPTE
jgi:HK97 family phage portal protein